MSIPLFLIPILAGLVAQALKPLFSRDQRDEQARTLDPRPRYGGMPSAHLAFVSSLVLTVGLTDGLSSPLFAVAAALAILALDDALRLRVFLSRYGLTIQRLLRTLPPTARRGLPPIEPRMGHSIPEVLVGIAVGVLVTLLLFTLDAALSLQESP